MLPSSRTPEGEPLRCSVCGLSDRILVSRPPSDTICPSCGSHAWVDTTAGDQDEVRRAIRTFLTELQSRCEKNEPVEEVGRILVEGLTNCMAAYGATLWKTCPRKWWIARPELLAVCSVGTLGDSNFANQVLTAKQPLLHNVEIDRQQRLIIGVPVYYGKDFSGVIQLIQRAGSPPNTVQGYLRFVNQTASLLSGEHS